MKHQNKRSHQIGRGARGVARLLFGRPTLRLISIGALVLAATSAHATVVSIMAFDDMIAQADLIVEGTVVDIKSQWADEKHTIYTFVTLADLRVIDGQVASSTLTLRFEGGQVGDTRITVVGSPSFTAGERELLFVRGNGVASSPIVGFFQGRFRIINGDVLDSSRISLVEIRDGAFIKIADSAVPTVDRLDEETLGNRISAGTPVEGEYRYGEGAGNQEEEEALKLTDSLPPAAALAKVSPPMVGPPALPPPVAAAGVAVIRSEKKASIFLDPSEDPGKRLSVEEFIGEIRARLSR